MLEGEKLKLAKDAYRFCNERARLQHALEITLESLGMDKYKMNTVINHVKQEADFLVLKAFLSKLKENDNEQR